MQASCFYAQGEFVVNEGQKKFFDYIMDKLAEGKTEAGVALLKEGFEKQANGTFSPAYMDTYNQKLLALLKPSAVPEVQAVLNQFGGEHISR